MELDEIIEGCYEHSRKHQAALYNLYAPKLYGMCLTYTNDRDAAQDILHDGFFKVFKKFDKYKKEWSLEAWVRRIVINTAIDYLRKNNRLTNTDFQTETYLHESFDNVTEDFKTGDLSTIINLLPTGARTIFNLYTIEGYKHKEIAKILGISEGTSKSQLSKAKSVLKDLVNKYYSK